MVNLPIYGIGFMPNRLLHFINRFLGPESIYPLCYPVIDVQGS